MNTTQLELEKFRKAYDSIRVTVYDDFMVYVTPTGMADLFSRNANTLIGKLNLDLTAIPKSTFPHDCFVVKSNQTIDI